MHNNEIHANNEAHKISGELRHHNFSAARHELAKEAHSPHEFKKLVDQLNHDLKAKHQHPMSVEHDKHGNVSHLNFGGHDIYDKSNHRQGKGFEHHQNGPHPHKSKDAPIAPHKATDAPSNPPKSSDNPTGPKSTDTDVPKKVADAAPKAPDAKAAADPNRPESAEDAASKNNELLKNLDKKMQLPAHEILDLSTKAGWTSKSMDRLRANIDELSKNPGLSAEDKMNTLNMVLAQRKNAAQKLQEPGRDI